MVVGLMSGIVFWVRGTRSQLVATVGNETITASDAKYRDQVIAYYYPGENRSLGAKQLVDAHVGAQILSRYGKPISDAQIEAEVIRIDHHTQMPEGLQKIKSIFAGDTAAYRRVFVFPVLVNRVLRFEFFPFQKEIHWQSWEKANRFLLEEASHDFKLSAKKAAAKYIEFELSSDGVRWKIPEASSDDFDTLGKPEQVTRWETKRKLASTVQGALWGGKLLPQLKPQQVFTEVVDTGEHWLVVKCLKQLGPGTFALEGVQFPKADFFEWYEQEKQKIVVRMF